MGQSCLSLFFNRKARKDKPDVERPFLTDDGYTSNIYRFSVPELLSVNDRLFQLVTEQQEPETSAEAYYTAQQILRITAIRLFKHRYPKPPSCWARWTWRRYDLEEYKGGLPFVQRQLDDFNAAAKSWTGT